MSNTKRGPYKRGHKSTETAHVVGIYEKPPTQIPKPEEFGFEFADPLVGNGGGWTIEGGEGAYFEALGKSVRPKPIFPQK